MYTVMKHMYVCVCVWEFQVNYRATNFLPVSGKTQHGQILWTKGY